MADDRELASLLGEAPPAVDPGFRIGVSANIAARAHRRAALVRGARRFGLFTAIGLAFPAADALRLSADLAPVAITLGVLGLAGLMALVATRGPGAVLTPARVALRVHA
ncbi:MAG: hypothetical protein R3C16_03500 [Hyphomonadaceae bacterium]